MRWDRAAAAAAILAMVAMVVMVANVRGQRHPEVDLPRLVTILEVTVGAAMLLAWSRLKPHRRRVLVVKGDILTTFTTTFITTVGTTVDLTGLTELRLKVWYNDQLHQLLVPGAGLRGWLGW